MKPVFPQDVVEAELKTRHDTFDRVVRHCRAQPRRGMSAATGRCSQRLGDQRCLIGALIDDEHFHPEVQGFRKAQAVAYNIAPRPIWFRENVVFLEDLQRRHDAASNWPAGRMDTVLKLLAAERGLTMPA